MEASIEYKRRGKFRRRRFGRWSESGSFAGRRDKCAWNGGCEESCVIELSLCRHDSIYACFFEASRDIGVIEYITVGKDRYFDCVFYRTYFRPVRETLQTPARYINILKRGSIDTDTMMAPLLPGPSMARQNLSTGTFEHLSIFYCLLKRREYAEFGGHRYRQILV